MNLDEFINYFEYFSVMKLGRKLLVWVNIPKNWGF